MNRKCLRIIPFSIVALVATLLPMFVAVGEAAAPQLSDIAAEQAQPVQGRPVRIVITSVGINLPVVDGVYKPVNKTWTLNQNAVQYATTTPQANDTAGNTFIYGHATWALFGNLVNIKPGDIAAVTTDNGNVFYYRFQGSVDVPPSDVGTIKYSGPSQLTVQTCVGTYYQNRRMFHFSFVKVDRVNSPVTQ